VADPAAGADERRVHRELMAVTTAFYEAIETGDLDTMRDLWLEDPGTVCVHPGADPVRGSGPVGRSWAAVMAGTAYIQFILTDVEVSLQGVGTGTGTGAPRVATVTCTENVLTGDERVGTQVFGGARAVATNVYVRTDDGWRLWVRHASPVPSHGDVDDER
jgi:ketosteroid isomerase-like protein